MDSGVAAFKQLSSIADRTLPVEIKCASHHRSQTNILQNASNDGIATVSAPDMLASERRKTNDAS